MHSRYLKAGGVRSHYVEAGTGGPPVVLLHGGTPGSSGESGFGPILGPLSEHFRVYAPDGVGGSGDTDPTFPAREGAHARVDQLEAFVDTLCLDPVFLVGSSQGSWVAARYAVLHPDRVKKMCLLGGHTLPSSMGLEIKDPAPKFDGSEATMRLALEGLIWNKSAITDELVASRTAIANRPGAAEARKIFLEGNRRLTKDPNMRLKFDLSYALPRLQVPIAFIWGECDQSAPVELGRKLHALLPNAAFHVVPEAGHQVQIDQPETVARIIAEFFAA